MNCPRCGYRNPVGFAFCVRCAAPLVLAPPWAWAGPGSETPPAPLVGRETEMAELQEAIRDLRAGQGSIVSLIGAAGLGKTRLVTELRRWTEQPGQDAAIPHPTWLTAAALPPGDEDQPGWGAGARLLLDYLGPAEEPATRLAQIVNTVVPAEAEFVLHYLAHLVAEPGESGPDFSDEPGQHHVCRAFFRLLSALAQQNPLVLVVEDLQWVDESSARLLEYLWPLVRHQPVLFLLLYEPAEKYRCWDLRRQAANLYADSYREVFLHPLPATGVTCLLDHLTGGEYIPPADLQAVLRASQGNPLFLRELVRWRQQMGLASWSQVNLPTGSALLNARVDLLGWAARHILELAAVIGLVFSRQVLAQVLIQMGGEEEDLQHLQRLQAVGMVQPWTAHAYAFTHYLLRQAVYETLSETTQAHLHLLVAQALEVVEGSASPARLAYHYAWTTRADQALRYMRLAGDQALRRYADDEAAAYYQAGLRLAVERPALASERPGLLRRLALVHARRGQWVEYLRAHEHALTTLAEDPLGQAEAYQAIAQAHRFLGDRAAEDYYIQKALAVLPATALPSRRAALLLAQSSIAWARGEAAMALNVAQQALNLADQAADSTLIVLAWNQVGAAHLLAGDDRQALNAFLQALEFCPSTAVKPTARLRTYLNAGEAQAQIAGEVALAQQLFEQALAEARRLGHDTWAMWAHLNLADLAFAQGAWEQAEEHLRQAEELSTGRNLAAFNLYSILLRGRLLLARGQAQVAYEQFRHATGLAEASGDVVQGLIPARLGQALALWAVGRPEPAARLLEQTLHLSQQEGTPAEVARTLFHLVRCLLAQGEVGQAQQTYERLTPVLANRCRPTERAQDRWLQGLLVATTDQPQLAERDLRASLQAWRRLGYRYEEAQVLLDLARFYLAQGRPAEAIQCQAEAIALFQLLGAAGDLAQAEALELTG